MAKYRKCTRCEVNYITDEKEYCDICLAEMKGVQVNADVEDDDLELCPRCHQNYIAEGERLCENCLMEQNKLKAIAASEYEWNDDDPTEIDVVEEDDIFIPDEVSLDAIGDEEWSTEDDALSDDPKSVDDIFIDDLDLDLDDDIIDDDIDIDDSEM
ncbi:MAG: hypothetical protein LBE09_01445 [Christensenellaceae bacterium]|jgi:Zn-finger nucleic acid-binding protein|nr:hypothetical protein [Christensenellaceae bacterium]